MVATLTNLERSSTVFSIIQSPILEVNSIIIRQAEAKAFPFDSFKVKKTGMKPLICIFNFTTFEKLLQP